jgi:putative oxidoreductase
MEPQPYRDAELAAFVMRVALGVMYASHGWLKLGIEGMAATDAYFESVGLPGELAYPTALAELVGGALLILGVHSRWVALGLLPILLGAIQVHWANGWLFSAEGGGWEFPAYLIVWSAGQALLGNGAFALADLKASAGALDAAR